jgi:dTDP-glucose 4,6-dehydratase
MILVTGGAGFIGSNFINEWISDVGTPVVNLDKLTYAGSSHNLVRLEKDSRHHFIKGDILDRDQIQKLLTEYRPSAVVNFAAETHVDRSIYDPESFAQTNVLGTLHLLQECYHYWDQLEGSEKKQFRFLHMSTDEVYGSLESEAPSSKETSRYAPNSPYAASKAAADHFVRSFHHTYGFPTLIAHSTNAYGPYQFPEKLIPLTIVNALKGKSIPLYGDGLNIRNWIYVKDVCQALRIILASGKIGESYNISDLSEKTNRDTLETICTILDQLHPSSPKIPHASLIQYVKDRPGHDRRYSMDSSKLRQDLGWKPHGDFKTNMRQTVEWYLNNSEWLEKIMDPSYQEWITAHYAGNKKIK